MSARCTWCLIGGCTSNGRVGQNLIYMWCIYDTLGRKIKSKCTVLYNAHTGFWPTLCIFGRGGGMCGDCLLELFGLKGYECGAVSR